MRIVHSVLLAILLWIATTGRPAAAQVIYALEMPSDAAAFALVSFDIGNPAQELSYRSIYGLNGFYLPGIEVHPLTGEVYGLGISINGSPQVCLFRLNLATAISALAVPVGPALSLTLGPRYGKYGFAFTPDGSTVRLTTPSGYNYRLDPNTGALLSTDAMLGYAPSDANAGQTVSVQSLAYAHGIMGNSGTQLFGIDRLGGRLVRFGVPTSGELQTVGNLGLGLEDPYTVSDLATLVGPTPSTNRLYILKTVDTYNGLYSYGVSTLYVVDPATAQPVLVGPVCSNGGSRLYLRDLAIPNATISASRDRVDLAQHLTVFPNPVRGGSGTSLAFTLPRASRAELTVCDNLGRTVTTQRAVLPAGANVLRWETGAAHPGLYLLRLAVDGQPVATRRVVLE